MDKDTINEISKTDWARLEDSSSDSVWQHHESNKDKKIAPSILSGQSLCPGSQHQESNKDKKIDWSRLENQLPDLVWRHRWDDMAEKFGLPFKRSYMQNMDSEGKGPQKKYLNKRVAYPLPSLITWLNSL